MPCMLMLQGLRRGKGRLKVSIGQTIAITGAGSGIGAALARAYARRGTRLFLAGRSVERLSEIQRDCEAMGAQVDVSVVDVRDADAVAAWIDQIDTATPIDLFIANAGIFAGRAAVDEFETAATANDVIQTNLLGAIHCARAISNRMAGRRSGHIALVSSLAAFAPSPDAQAYSASKAGLSAFAEALREDLAAHGVSVSAIHPGHVETYQTEQQDGPTPLMISAEDAAQRIVAALDAGRTTLSFPRLASFWVRAIRIMPWRWRARLNASSRFTVRPTDWDRPGD